MSAGRNAVVLDLQWMEDQRDAAEARLAMPGLRVMARIAKALQVDLDDLVPWSQD